MSLAVTRVDRFNGGALRRYHFNNGAIGVVARLSNGARQCSVIPAFCRHIAFEIEPATLLQQLRQSRQAA